MKHNKRKSSLIQRVNNPHAKEPPKYPGGKKNGYVNGIGTVPIPHDVSAETNLYFWR